jgi:hypothetical protein
MRSMTISLDGLLDYDEEDREECTFEVTSLFFITAATFNRATSSSVLCEASRFLCMLILECFTFWGYLKFINHIFSLPGLVTYILNVTNATICPNKLLRSLLSCLSIPEATKIWLT